MAYQYIVTAWNPDPWFTQIVSAMRKAIGDALSEVEERDRRLQLQAWLQRNGIRYPEDLSNRQLVMELAKAMTKERLEGRDLRVFESLYGQLPAMQRLRDALYFPALHEHVKIPPAPPVMVDGRIDSKQFWDELNKQVFIIKVET